MTNLNTTQEPIPNRRSVLLGEAMIELSSVSETAASLGVAGDSFNTAIYMSRLGHQVAYMTGLGDDPFSQRVIRSAEAEGIQTDLVAKLPGKVVGAYAISLDDKGERHFTYWRSASAVRSLFEVGDIDRLLGSAEQAQLFYLSGISLSLFAEDNRSKLLSMMGRRRSSNHWNAFDGNYRPACWRTASEARAALEGAVSVCQISLPTFEDEAELFGDKTPERTAERHLRLGAEEVVVKCGPRGAYVSGVGWVTPSNVISPIDTTGAGDSFNAAYLAARLTDMEPEKAADRGNQLAGAVIQAKGAILPKPQMSTLGLAVTQPS